MVLALTVLIATVAAASPAAETAEKRFEKTLAREFTIIGTGSSAQDPLGTRANWLDLAMKRPWPRHQVRVIKVLEAGNAAVVHAILTGDYPPMPWVPEGGTVRFLITDTWIERDGRWQVLARHSTRVTEPAP
jgi:hypothetical protein